MSLLVRPFVRVTQLVAGSRPARQAASAHGWLVRRSGGRLGGRLVGSPVLVLRTTGRRSGQPRDAPLFYVREGDGFAVIASNAGQASAPAWWLNLQAAPEATVLVRGREHRVRARRATPEEHARLWPRLQAQYPGYDAYRARTTREIPVVVLEPAPAAARATR